MQIMLQPLVSASLSRMPDSLGSLALWPVLYGVLIMINSAAIAYVEAVIVLLDRPGSIEALQRFAWQLGLALAAIPLALAVTPIGDYLFERVTALPPELLRQAQITLWLMIPLPALTALSSWFQGALINGQRTRSITEAVSSIGYDCNCALDLRDYVGRTELWYRGWRGRALWGARRPYGGDRNYRRFDRAQHLAVAAHEAGLSLDSAAPRAGVGSANRQAAILQSHNCPGLAFTGILFVFDPSRQPQ